MPGRRNVGITVELTSFAENDWLARSPWYQYTRPFNTGSNILDKCVYKEIMPGTYLDCPRLSAEQPNRRTAEL